MGAAPGRSEIDQDPFLRRSRDGRFCHAHPVPIQPPRRGCPVAVGGVDGGPVGYRGRGRVRARSPGRADPAGTLRAGLRGARADPRDRAAAAQLPSRVGVYFVLALALFPGVGSAKVWASMLAGLGAGLRVSVSDKALRDLRRRAAPVKALFETLAGPVAQPSTPGVRFGRYRTVAFDGCVSIKVPDTDRNRSWLGKLRAAHGVTGYPVAKLMTLVETDPRPAGCGVRRRRPQRPTTRVACWVCSTGTCWCCSTAASTPASSSPSWPAPARSSWPDPLDRKLPVLARCADGSYLSCIDALTVRVITADITVTCADGSSYTANTGWPPP